MYDSINSSLHRKLHRITISARNWPNAIITNNDELVLKRSLQYSTPIQMPLQLKNYCRFAIELRQIIAKTKPSTHKPVIKLSNSVTAISVNAVNHDRSNCI